MKILAIGAHPDDIEIFMYGTLSACLNRGDEIAMIVVTDGSAGNVLSKDNLAEIRKKETINALKYIGKPTFLEFSDGELSIQIEAINILKRQINKLNPDLIITHAPEDYHPDHRALSQFVKNSAGFKFPVIYCETLLGINFNPQFYIDISKYFEAKKKAILKHKSQSPEKFLKAIEINNIFRAAQCNAGNNSYAEVFRFDSSFPFVDISSLLPDRLSIRPYYKNLPDSLI